MTFFMPLLFIVLPGLAQQPQNEEPVFRAGVSLVKVDVQVVRPNGSVIPGLSAEDFQVYDQAVPQRIAFFGREAEALDLLLLLDVSGSMRRHLEEMAGTAQSALRHLHPGDRVALMLFAREAAVRAEFTEDFRALQEQIQDAVRERSLGSGTAINSAIIAAARYAGSQPVRGRRAVLIVTDNLSLNYRVPDDEVIRALYTADAVLNAILIGKQRRPDPPPSTGALNPDFTPADVFKLAQETGGEAVESRRVADSFPQMIERIRARYSLQYPAPAAEPGTFRRIRVELTAAARKRYPGAVVRARGGYFTPK